jgi:hypothetical protein
MKPVLSFFFIFLLILSSSSGMSKTVTGSVTKIGGGVLSGASVTAKGVTSVFTLTDALGNYSIDLPTEVSVLIFSYSGMQSQEIEIGVRSVINVSLTPFNFPRIRIGLGFSFGGAKVGVRSPNTSSADTAIHVQLNVFSLHSDLSYNFNKKFYLQSVLEADFNSLNYNDKNRDTKNRCDAANGFFGFGKLQSKVHRNGSVFVFCRSRS